MSRALDRLAENTKPEVITPRRAIALLIYGLLPPDDAENFKPANLSVETIVRMLRQSNEVRNRTVSIDHVYKLARDMTNNKWLWTGDPIKIDTAGYVRDGQHRLLAVIHSGTTQTFNVVRNVTPESQLAMDVGRPRGVAGQMQMVGHASSAHVTAIANMLLRWRAKRMLNTHQSSVMEVAQILAEETDIHAALTATWRIRRNINRAPQAALGAAYVEAGHLDAEARDEFFELLTTGAGLQSGSPILVLRNKMSGQVAIHVRYQRAGQLWQIVHAWNKWRQGKTLSLMVVPKSLTSDTFPTML